MNPLSAFFHFHKKISNSCCPSLALQLVVLHIVQECLSKCSCYFMFQNLRQQILELLGPISMNHGVHFMAAIAFVWNERRQNKNASRTKVCLY